MFRKGVSEKMLLHGQILILPTQVIQQRLTEAFNSYFVTTVMQGSIDATFVWTVILSISYFFNGYVLLIFYADYKNFHKQFLIISSIVCVILTF